MKLKTLCTAMLLAGGSIGIACASPTNMITNGDFSSATSPYSGPTQFGTRTGTSDNGTGSPCTYGGQFVDGWSGNNGYGIWYPNATAASTENACTQFGKGDSGDGTSQRLPSTVTAPPVGSGAFIGLDGQPGLNFGVSQTLSGLIPGDKYTVSFYWATTQEMSKEGATNEMLQVALGNQALFTPVNVCGGSPYNPIYPCRSAPSGWVGQSYLTPSQHIGTHGWSGWMQQTFTFTAGSPSDVLSFLSVGTPRALPPFAVMAGVSMSHNVPEPPELALFGGGLLGLGFLTVLARRREMRRRAAANKG